MSSQELERYTNGLPRMSRQQLQQTFTQAVDARMQVQAVWAVTNHANRSFAEAEQLRRELAGDDQLYMRVTSQWMATACAKTQQIIQGMYGTGVF
jgi:hypothetical protein